RLVQGLIVLFGMVFSFACFLTVGNYVQGLVKKEYDEVTKNTANVLVKGLLDLEKSINHIAKSIEDASGIGADNPAKILERIAPYVNDFDQIVFMNEKEPIKEPGLWRFQNLFITNETEQIFGSHQMR